LITETRTHRVEPDVTVFEISGRLSLGNLLQSAESAIRGLIEGGARKMVIDLSGLTAIDSSGLGMLISSFGIMDQHGGQMRVAGAHRSVGKILETVHIDRIIPLDPDVAQACRNFSVNPGK
jgi:anti-sigma B factor antagonist